MTPAAEAKQVESREQAEPANPPLDEAVKQIRADAADDPEGYARDAIVSKGGE